VGWRVWSVVHADGELRLSSLVYHEVWEPGSEARARCRRVLAALPWGRLPLHEAPAFACCCGIHGLGAPELAARYLHSKVENGPRAVHRVLGAVSLWGRVVETENGWRAACGYPQRIVVPSDRLERLVAVALWPYRLTPRAVARELEAYRVEVEVVDMARLPALRSPRPVR
jgi:hypothetical protein